MGARASRGRRQGAGGRRLAQGLRRWGTVAWEVGGRGAEAEGMGLGWGQWHEAQAGAQAGASQG